MDEYFTLEEIAEILRKSIRIGEEIDKPEGVRYIQISDTLAKKIVASIEYKIEKDWQDMIDRMGEDA